jgi:hypothetical protein
MEVQFTPDVQAKLDQMARETGRRSDELVQDAVIVFTRGCLSAAIATSKADARSPLTARKLTAGSWRKPKNAAVTVVNERLRASPGSLR